MSARRAHQLVMAGLTLMAFVLGSFLSDWVGMALLAVTTLVMLVGGIWGSADAVQRLIQGPAERRGMSVRPEPVEGARRRRLVRLVQGGVLLLATALVTAGASHAGWGFDLAGWVLALLTAAMGLLDGVLDLL